MRMPWFFNNQLIVFPARNKVANVNAIRRIQPDMKPGIHADHLPCFRGFAFRFPQPHIYTPSTCHEEAVLLCAANIRRGRRDRPALQQMERN
ncbi:hypothetical protein ALC57_04965 [Trachymyrmex cornetzi]|uniref:Uncharacterized protein n=1 Tax=Trachymyrmex cornetzi TaxID=471704 RepID=A0A151JBY0_9HYME|nr:hypothetical protein ALC57_04965 [Trachymyrmex cornetzi]